MSDQRVFIDADSASGMTIGIEVVHRDLLALREDVAFIKRAIMEESELSDEAKKSLAAARATPEAEYVELE